MPAPPSHNWAQEGEAPVRWSGAVGQRRGARGGSGVERRTVDSYVCERDGVMNGDARGGDSRPGQLGKIDVRLRNASAADAHTDRVSTRVARVGLPFRVVVTRDSVMVEISYCWMIVDGWCVVVIGVIVPDVLVDVQ